MKANKLLSLDIEVLERLAKEPNQSSLVNELLKRHYDLSKLAQLPLERLKEIKKAQIDLEAARRNLEALHHV